jgi:hypothetical protein
VGAKFVIEMNMKPYIPWLLVVGGQVQGSRLCVQEEGCCTTGLVNWYGGGGEWPVGIVDSDRLNNELSTHTTTSNPLTLTLLTFHTIGTLYPLLSLGTHTT